MKCELPTRDGTECGADLSPTEQYCAICGGKVEVDESKTKECPECSKILISTVNFCTGCSYPFADVTKTITCEGKKEDGRY